MAQLAQDQATQSDSINFETASKGEATKFITYKLTEYGQLGLQDNNLWEQFQEDFCAFTPDRFFTCNQGTIRTLRRFLRQHSVWVQSDHKLNANEALFKTIQEQESVKQSESEIRSHIEANRAFTL